MMRTYCGGIIPKLLIALRTGTSPGDRGRRLVAHPPLFTSPLMGNSRLAEVVDRHGADLVVHGHAHHGKLDGKTAGGVPVHNVAISLLQAQEASSVYRIFDI